MTPDGEKRLLIDEGSRQFVYDDATGESLKPGMTLKGWPTIGIGRNLATKGLTQGEIGFLFTSDQTGFWNEIIATLPWANMLVTQARGDVLFMVEFNTGNVFAFRQMLSAMAAGNWEAAAVALLDSKAAKELPARYERMATALRSNSWEANGDPEAEPSRVIP